MNRHPEHLTPELAAELLQAGQVVAFPTETVYGLGADASQPAALKQIYTLKGRPNNHPLIVHLPGVDWVKHWSNSFTETGYALADAFWPGPLTLITHKAARVNTVVTGGQMTVGLRVPAHSTALALLRAFAENNFAAGIAAPSANRFGRISPTSAEHVRAEFSDRVPVLADLPPFSVFSVSSSSLPHTQEVSAKLSTFQQIGIESTIVDLTSVRCRILRPGHITPEDLARVLGYRPEIIMTSCTVDTFHADVDSLPKTPGSHAMHYAPITPSYLIPADAISAVVASLEKNGCKFTILDLIGGKTEKSLPQAAKIRELPITPEGYAQHMYAGLRELDEVKADIMLVIMPPETSEYWLAIHDRLRRATRPMSQLHQDLPEL